MKIAKKTKMAKNNEDCREWWQCKNLPKPAKITENAKKPPTMQKIAKKYAYLFDNFDLCILFNFVKSWGIKEDMHHLKLQAHVLVHLLKSFRAYIVKSSSTLFSDNIQWNLEISFSYARFNSLLGYNLLIESWDHQEWVFSDPCILKLKNTLSNVIYCFEKH